MVIGGLVVGYFTPTEASAIGVFVAFVFGLAISRDLTLKKLYVVFVTTAKQASVVMMLVGGSAILGQVLANERIPQELAEGLGALTDSPVVMILLPLAVQFGIDPVHFGIIVCLNLGIGQQTPPVASIVLTVCSVTGVKLEEIMRYNKWFILVMFTVLMIVSYVPMTALWFR